MNRGLFYGAAAQLLVPAWADWAFSCHQRVSKGELEDIAKLNHSLIARIDRALRARDRVHWQFQIPQNKDTADEALLYLDAFLLQLGGGFDAIARVLHRLGGLPANTERRASFRSDGWMASLAATNAASAGIMAKGQPHRLALEVIAVLRNSIHAAHLNSVAFSEGVGRGPVENRLWLPKADERMFREAIAGLGGDDEWGVQDLPGIGVTVTLDRFVEQALGHGTAALNALLQADTQAVVAPAPRGYHGLLEQEWLPVVSSLAGICL